MRSKQGLAAHLQISSVADIARTECRKNSQQELVTISINRQQNGCRNSGTLTMALAQQAVSANNERYNIVSKATINRWQHQLIKQQWF